MNVFLHETFSCKCMCRKPGILPLFDNAVVILFSWFYGECKLNCVKLQ